MEPCRPCGHLAILLYLFLIMNNGTIGINRDVPCSKCPISVFLISFLFRIIFYLTNWSREINFLLKAAIHFEDELPLISLAKPKRSLAV